MIIFAFYIKTTIYNRVKQEAIMLMLLETKISQEKLGTNVKFKKLNESIIALY